MPVLLVTHQVNSAALTGTQPTSSELVIFKHIPDGSQSVAGTLVTVSLCWNVLQTVILGRMKPPSAVGSSPARTTRWLSPSPPYVS